MSSKADEFYLALVAPSGECLRGKAQLIGLFIVSSTWRRRFWQPTFSGLNLVVAAVLRDIVCVSLLPCVADCCMSCCIVYCLCKVERIVLTELNEDYYYYY